MNHGLVAHRGYCRQYPENSLAALQAALQLGCQGIELDVQMSADGCLFVLHDENLLRTTGVKQNITAIQASQLAKQRLLNPDGSTSEQSIPTLEAALSLLADYPEVQAFVEIKSESLQRFGMESVWQALLDSLLPLSAHCTLISFDYSILQRAKDQGITTGWVLHRYDERHRQQAMALQPDLLICNYRKLPGCHPPWPGPWQWMLYEINSPQTALEWIQQGVQWIETAALQSMLADATLQEQWLCRNNIHE